MVEFMSSYLPAMERFEERPIPPTFDVEADIEKPLIPIGEIGTTSVDAGQGNILQELEKNIKFGAKKIQIVFSGRGGSGVSAGGGPTLYGKEVRENLREKAKATGVELVGVELSPGVISGLAGFDPQNGRITEERRQADMKKVRDAIRFAADVSRGGGVDLWSQEFNRTVFDAEWNRNPSEHSKDWKGMFYDYSPDELDPNAKTKPSLVKYLLDKRNGQMVQGSVVRTGEDVTELKYMTAKDYEKHFGVSIIGSVDEKGNKVEADKFVNYKGTVIDENDPNATFELVPYFNPETHHFEKRNVKWQEIIDRTAKYNEKNGTNWAPEEYVFRTKLMNQQALARGQSLQYTQGLEGFYDQLRELSQLQDLAADLEKRMSPDERQQWIQNVLLPRLRQQGIGEDAGQRLLKLSPSQVVQDAITRQKNQLHAYQYQATSQKIQEEEFKETAENIVTPEKFAFERSIDSYSDLGIDAMKVTQEQKLLEKSGGKPVYIGPELGWAGESFGGHPEEFVKLIKKSREEMTKKLVKEGYDQPSAEELAKTHIKGMVDTSHLAMWFKHFRKKPDWDDKKHLDEFNKWMKAQAKYLGESGVVGAVQVVDSITGEHSHLPAGQGVFEVAEFVKEMKDAGFKGPIIAEGHEEDTMNFGQGRILTETWKAFGSNIAPVQGMNRMGLRGWGGMHQSYFGQVTPPTYIVGAYAPSNEWSLWSETPFE